jgi:glutamate--cysteine ligase
MAWHTALGSRVASSFPERHARPGTVGRESEFPLVHPDGTCGDLLRVWPILAENGPKLREKREVSGLLVELHSEDALYVAEVGRGTVEIVVGPHETLHGTRDAHLRARERLLEAVEAAGQKLLGYGIQPRTPPCAPIMTPKQRYSVLHEVIGDPWLWFTVTASDQVHLAVDRPDVMETTRVAHLLTPVLVALCGNSPVGSGRDHGVTSVRETRMGEIHSNFGRHGIPPWPDRDWTDLVARYARQPWLVRSRNGVYGVASGRFDDWLARMPHPDDAGETAREQIFSEFLMHEHYIWNSARPRTAHGTVEIRPACQQPLHESMTAAALGVGIASGARALGTWLDTLLGPEAWRRMHQWHHTVVRDGLQAPPPVPGLLQSALERIEAALIARGHGEEVYLRPAFERLDRGRNPADDARAAFQAGGIVGLVDYTAKIT